MKGRERLRIEWDPGANQNFDSGHFLKHMHDQLAKEPGGYFVREDGDAKKALAGATKNIETTYEFPFQAHAPSGNYELCGQRTSSLVRNLGATQCPEVAQIETAKDAGIARRCR
jgi:isoquinoline 1-oxidoreductase beta subunit